MAGFLLRASTDLEDRTGYRAPNRIRPAAARNPGRGAAGSGRTRSGRRRAMPGEERAADAARTWEPTAPLSRKSCFPAESAMPQSAHMAGSIASSRHPLRPECSPVSLTLTGEQYVSEIQHLRGRLNPALSKSETASRRPIPIRLDTLGSLDRKRSEKDSAFCRQPSAAATEPERARRNRRTRGRVCAGAAPRFELRADSPA